MASVSRLTELRRACVQPVTPATRTWLALPSVSLTRIARATSRASLTDAQTLAPELAVPTLIALSATISPSVLASKTFTEIRTHPADPSLSSVS